MSTANLAQYGIAQGNIRQLFGEILVEIGRKDPNVVVVDCQTAMPTAASLFAKALPERFIDLGIAEQNAVSFAAGLARMGFVPIVPLFACFSSRRALDQVTIQVAYAGLNVKVCGLYAGLTSPNTGATHQMVSDVAILRALPNMTIVEPADAIELMQALPAVVEHRGPVYFRLVRGDVGGSCPRVSPDGYEFRLGRAALFREGRDVTLIGSGLMVSRCLAAAETLAKEGISADVVNISTLKPLDTDLIVSCARRTGAVVTAENHTVLGGLGGAVAEVLGDAAPVPFRRVGIQDRFGTSGPLDELFPEYGLTAKAVCEAARAALGAKTRP
ncbi:MAG TPA: transketolase C-terminal domain-containing protein [Candidatus Methylomirabilis sp.]|nr:transketolase C-terminal domain-containing protein [Candidatus Methylomirabilis sp.]